MGLFDDPQNAGLLDFGLGLMQASGPSRMPVSMGQAIGSAGQGAMKTMREVQQEQMRQQFQGVQMQQMQAKMRDQQEQMQKLKAFRDQLPPALQQAFDVNPEMVIKQMFKEPEKPQLVTVAGPNGEPMQKWVRPGESSGVDIGTAPNKESALPWYVKKGPDGRTSIDPAYADFEKSKAGAGRPVTPYFQFLPTAEGYAVGNARTGGIAPAAIDGKPVIKASDDPALQGRIAGAKEFSKTQAEDQAKAQADYPRIVQNSETAIKYADELMKHPGFSQAVGKSSILGVQKIPGTDAKGFMNRLDQIKGGAFLEAFNSLKGGGQITEVEGKKATDAIARMDNATSEEDFRAAVNDYKAVVRAGMNRAKMKARPVAPVAPPQAPQGGAKFLGFE